MRWCCEGNISRVLRIWKCSIPAIIQWGEIYRGGAMQTRYLRIKISSPNRQNKTIFQEEGKENLFRVKTVKEHNVFIER